MNTLKRNVKNSKSTEQKKVLLERLKANLKSSN